MGGQASQPVVEEVTTSGEELLKEKDGSESPFENHSKINFVPATEEVGSVHGEVEVGEEAGGGDGGGAEGEDGGEAGGGRAEEDGEGGEEEEEGDGGGEKGGGKEEHKQELELNPKDGSNRSCEGGNEDLAGKSDNDEVEREVKRTEVETVQESISCEVTEEVDEQKRKGLEIDKSGLEDGAEDHKQGERIETDGDGSGVETVGEFDKHEIVEKANEEVLGDKTLIEKETAVDEKKGEDETIGGVVKVENEVKGENEVVDDVAEEAVGREAEEEEVVVDGEKKEEEVLVVREKTVDVVVKTEEEPVQAVDGAVAIAEAQNGCEQSAKVVGEDDTEVDKEGDRVEAGFVDQVQDVEVNRKEETESEKMAEMEQEENSEDNSQNTEDRAENGGEKKEEPVNEDETIETLKVVEVEKVQEKLLFDESTGDKDENVGKGEPSHEEIFLKEECDKADLADFEQGLNKVEIETSGDVGMLPPSIYQV